MHIVYTLCLKFIFSVYINRFGRPLFIDIGAREHHELNPFANANPFANGGGEGLGQQTTSFTGEYDQGYQQSGGGGAFPRRYCLLCSSSA